MVYSYIQHRELCVNLYLCTVIYSRGNCVYSCIGVLLYTAVGIVSTAEMVYYYIQHRNCVQLYWCTLIYSTDKIVYSCVGLQLYTAQAIVCTAVLVYSFLHQR